MSSKYFRHQKKSKITTNELYNSAVILFQNGRLADAESKLRQLLDMRPDSVQSINLLSIVCCQLGKFEEALALNAKALNSNNNNHEFHYNRGIILYYFSKPDDAIESFNKAISIKENSSSYHHLGIIYKDKNDLEKSLYYYQKALNLNPDIAESHFNTGLILSKLEKFDDAIVSFEKAISINNQYAEAFLYLGHCYAKKDINRSLEFYKKSLSLNPNIDDAHFNIGLIFSKLNDIDKAIIALKNTVTINNKHSEAFYSLGNCYRQKGMFAEAADMYRKVIELDPEHLFAKYLLSALLGETLTAVPEQYVADLFDWYSEDFENHLTTELEYRIPKLLRTELDSIRKDEKPFNNVIDLGCGTGLCGIEFREIAHRLSGVDLSPKILQKARDKKIYDDLKVCNINDIAKRMEKYDLVIAADVFIYVGDLSASFDVFDKITTNDAFIVFSIEITDAYPFELQKSGRFAHSHAYIIELANQHNLAVKHTTSVQLRKEYRDWLQGEIFILHKPR